MKKGVFSHAQFTHFLTTIPDDTPTEAPKFSHQKSHPAENRNRTIFTPKPNHHRKIFSCHFPTGLPSVKIFSSPHQTPFFRRQPQKHTMKKHTIFPPHEKKVLLFSVSCGIIDVKAKTSTWRSWKNRWHPSQPNHGGKNGPQEKASYNRRLGK